MGTVFSVVIGVIVVCAVLNAWLGSPKESTEDKAKVGAAAGGYFILSLLPVVIPIVLIVLLVKACD